jgi:hypothetical protein
MIFETSYHNIDQNLEDVTPAQIESLQKQEIECLNIIYYKELKLLTSMFPFKLQIGISPFLEISHLILPPDYKNMDVTLIIELSESYPFKYPLIKFYSSNRDVLRDDRMKELEAVYTLNAENPSKTFIIQELVEKVRDILYDLLKSEMKGFKRIRHFMDEEESEEEEFYAVTKWDNIENLKKKDTTTPFSVEGFLDWNRRFLMEVNRQDLEAKKKEKNRDRPTGKEIFMNKANMLFIEDGGNGEDDDTEGFDFKDVIHRVAEPEVDVDADLFADEDDMLDELIEDDN